MILMIDNYDSFTYNVYQYIGSLYPQIQVVRNDEITIDEIRNLQNLEALVISPGPGYPDSAGISKDVIAEDFRPVETAIAYENAGAVAISCLTEEHYFKGGSKYFADIRAKVDIPMLRKDFIFDEYQIYEAKVLGADAILLIAAILSEEKIKEFYDLAKSLELDCLVEVHNKEELKKVVACGCDIIGINNRNLKTFDVDINTTSKLAPLIPYEAVLVSESGMKDENDMKNVKEQGADAVLIGETFMRSDNIKETMKQLRSCL